MAETIRDVMTRNPTTLESSSSAVEAARAMRDENVGLIPIVEGGRLIGTVTDRDIAVRIVAEGKSPDRIHVGEIASRKLVTIDAAQELDEALRLMAKHQMRRLPVVEKDGKLIGIVAQADVATHATSTQTGEVVEKISN
jgi:CBS domain-containing protein